MVFLAQFGIYWHLCVVQKAEIARAESGSYNFSFLKNSDVQISSKLISKQYDYR